MGTIWEERDGTYVVKVYEVKDERRGRERVRYRTDAYYDSHRKSTLSRSTFGRFEDAREVADLLWTDYAQGLHTAPEAAPETLQDLIERFCCRTTAKKGRELSAKTTKASYPSQLQALTRICGIDLPVRHLSKQHVEAVKSLTNLRTGKPLSPHTVASYLRAASAMFTWAVAQGYVTVNVADDVMFDPGPQELRPWLQPDEIEPFLNACRPSLKVRAAFAIETGLRASELVHMRWAWIHFGGTRPVLRIPVHDHSTGFTVKWKRARAIPLSVRAQALLDDAMKMWGRKGFVLHGHPKPINSTNLCRDTHLACCKAGVTDTDTHGLRRTAGARWLSKNVGIYRVSRLLGHSSVTTTEQAYAGLAVGHLDAAMDLMDAA